MDKFPKDTIKLKQKKKICQFKRCHELVLFNDLWELLVSQINEWSQPAFVNFNP